MTAEQAIKQSEENFRTLVENTSDSILIIDANGTHLYANQRHAERYRARWGAAKRSKNCSGLTPG